MKKSTNVITEVTETMGTKFFTVAITDVEGDTHTDKFSDTLMAKFIANGVVFSYDDTDEELTNSIQNAELGFVEVAEEDGEYDVYYHGVTIDGGDIELDLEGKYLKTYKKLNSALTFARKSAKVVMEA